MTSSRMRTLGEAALGIALLFGIFQSGCSGTFEVKDASNKTCILADLSINFAVEYKKGAKEATVLFPLPDNAVVSNMSTCSIVNATGPLLAIAFGSGHSLSIHFTKSDAEYQVNNLTFTYNLSDSSLFPESAENGTKQVSSNNTEISAKTNRFYQCASPHLIIMGSVNATFQNVKLEAYLNGNNYSVNGTEESVQYFTGTGQILVLKALSQMHKFSLKWQIPVTNRKTRGFTNLYIRISSQYLVGGGAWCHTPISCSAVAAELQRYLLCVVYGAGNCSTSPYSLQWGQCCSNSSVHWCQLLTAELLQSS